MSVRSYVDHTVDEDTSALLTSGDVDGTPLKPEDQFPEGVTAKRSDGQKVFLSQDTIDIAKYRNRGRD